MLTSSKCGNNEVEILIFKSILYVRKDSMCILIGKFINATYQLLVLRVCRETVELEFLEFDYGG